MPRAVFRDLFGKLTLHSPNDRLKYTINKHRTDISKLLSDLCSKGYLYATGKGRGTKYFIAHPQIRTLNLFENEQKVESNKQKVESNEQKVESNKQKVESNKPRKNLSRQDLENFILAITKDKYLSLNEIATQTGKSKSYLQNKIVPEMIKRNLLKRMYPETNSPGQKYRAVNLSD